MKVYLVGGAVRDKLMGLPVKECDWVVVGATQEVMIGQGYKQVGKDFPVFLHPKTKEEYALARTERKTGHGYDGFTVHADPNITLEQDLLRRDLTINAIAEDTEGQLIDYFGGVNDIKNRILRHVSSAFEEDPLRLIRLCRFKARFPDFSIHPETMVLCQKMVKTGEIDHLTPERVWLEWQKVFRTGSPDQFIKALHQMQAWAVLMPEFNQIEEDMKRVKRAAETMKNDHLMATLGWYLKPEVQQAALQALRLPKNIIALSALARKINAYYLDNQLILTANELLDALYQWDVFRRPSRFKDAFKIVQATIDINQRASKLPNMIDEIVSVRLEISERQGLNGQEIAEVLYQKRLQRCQEALKN